MNAAAAPEPLLSVVVPVGDGWEQTFRLLMALVECCRDLPHEVIVVDDGTRDETALALPRLPGLHLHRNPEPCGLVAAVNQGASLARGRYLAVVGQGVVPRPAWPRGLLQVLEGSPDVAAAGPQLLDPAGLAMSANVAASWAATEGLALPGDRPVPAALALEGLVVRRQVFMELGGLDVAYRDHGAEIDLGLRLGARGLRQVVVQDCAVERHEPWGAGRPLSRGDRERASRRLGGPEGARWMPGGAPRPLVSVVPREALMLAAQERMAPAQVLLDIGCGIRPQRFVLPKVHLCCEPYDQYLQQLQAGVARETDRHYVLVKATWAEALERFPAGSVDSVFLLDIIEHLEKDTSRRLLEATERLARRQVVVFTTLGFVAQHHPDGKDAWGLDGASWQEHRSGWEPADFGPGWEVLVSPDFHTHDNLNRPYDVPQGALWAIRNLA